MQKEEIIATLDEYKLTVKLGEGSYGSVYKATIDFNHYFACKISFYDDPSCTYQNETSILFGIEHPNICKSYFKDAKKGVFIFSDNNARPYNVTYILLEYIPCGELLDYLICFHLYEFSPRELISEKMARYIFLNIISGLKYLHDHDYVHRDIKPDNIVLDQNYIPKLVDFGKASKICGNEDDKMFKFPDSTYTYLAPEVKMDKFYKGRPVDVFAAGVTLLRIIMRVYPETRPEVIKKNHDEYIANKKIYDLKNLFPTKKHLLATTNTTESFKNLIMSLLAYDPSERPTCNEILNHPWMKNEPLPNHEEIFQEFSLMEIKILEKKGYFTNRSFKKYLSVKNLLESIFWQTPKGRYMSGGELIDMKDKAVRRYDRPYGFITAQELNFEDQYILQFIVEYVKQRNGKFHVHDKYMGVSVDINHEGELVKFNAEVMRHKDINVLVFDKKEGDKLYFFSIYHEIIDCMIEAYC